MPKFYEQIFALKNFQNFLVHVQNIDTQPCMLKSVMPESIGKLIDNKIAFDCLLLCAAIANSFFFFAQLI